MSSAPFDPGLVVARLKAEVPGLQQVGFAADLAAIAALRDFRPPAAFAVLAEEEASANPAGHPAGKGRQMVAARFGVTLAVRNYRADDGAAANDDLRAVLGAVRDTLIGWVPDLAGGRGCRLIKGQVLDYDAGTLLWSDVYETQHAIGAKE